MHFVTIYAQSTHKIGPGALCIYQQPSIMYLQPFRPFSCEIWCAPKLGIIATIAHSHHGYHYVRPASLGAPWALLHADNVLLTVYHQGRTTPLYPDRE